MKMRCRGSARHLRVKLYRESGRSRYSSMVAAVCGVVCVILVRSGSPDGCRRRERDDMTQDLTWVSVLAALVAGGLLSFTAVHRTRAEPRRLSNGVWIVAAGVISLAAVSGIDGQVSRLVAALTWLPLLLSPLLLLVLIVLLVVNGARMVRREGRSLGNLLSLVLALLLTALAALPFAAFLAGSDVFLAVALFFALGAAYLGAAFVLFLGYSWFYGRLVRGAVGSWVVVLGSGLSGGRRVPPLLAARIRAGLDAADRVGASLVVMSGGQGSDEALAEGHAMREWALDPVNVHGRRATVETAPAVAGPRILSEEKSTNTEENLRFTMAILEREGVTGPGIIATSNYHAMRAAMLARELGIDAQAVQAPVARYYWPSAILREFAAILRRYLLLNLLAGLLFALPLPLLSLWVAFGAS
ncbi:YdcF family protein [Pseudoclavibacter terrae]|uniref:YdcF family protein n=2 Tax=Pseudoclavibacter terrae TaxID=1530195 RepID=A0A7J5B6S7_9MICO|nr:YdcF family protein [Pseudoclavibacter terrae]